MELNKDKHKSVLLSEAVSYLNVGPGKKFIDSTVGGGGHTEAILRLGGAVLGIDQDPTSLANARRNLTACPGAFRLVCGNFARIAEIASKEGFNQVDGILFDLGFASFQVDDPARGLSFSKRGPLDMRLDPALAITAADIVNNFPEKKIEELLKEFGGEPKARFVAREIVRHRENVGALESTADLKNIVDRIYGGAKAGKISSATRTFQSLRIAVNAEYENLKQGLEETVNLLKSNGRLVVISFHSGEDRIVKNFMRNLEQNGQGKRLTRKPVVPSLEETSENPRARSAKLRAFEKA